MRHCVFIAASIAFLVFGAASSHAQDLISGAGGTVDASISPDVTVKLVSSSASKFKILNSSNAELMRIQSNGYVGIGNPSPLTEALQVKGAVKVTGVTTTVTASSSSFDYFSDGAHSDGGRIVAFGPNTSTPATFQLFLKKSDGSEGPAGGIPFRVDSSGRVGIDLPNYGVEVGEALQVNGAVKVTGVTQTILANSTSLDYVSSGSTILGARIVSFGPNPATPATFRLVLRSSDSSIGNDNAIFVDSSSNVGISTTTPTQKLEVAGKIFSNSGGFQFPDLSLQTTAYPFNTSTNAADLNRNVAALLTSSVTNVSTDSAASASLTALAGSGVSYIRVGTTPTATKDWRIGLVDATGIFKIRDNTVAGAPGDRMTINGSSIHFNGNVDATTIQANYQDVAEWVPAVGVLAAGTVVVVGEDADNTVTASMHAYDTTVAGVVSASPGLLLGVASATKAKIATTGRVRVRVDATKSPIRKGDLLVTSDRPGMAMKSEPLDLGGVKLHRPGTLIGKALEPLASGQGEILVLLSLQ